MPALGWRFCLVALGLTVATPAAAEELGFGAHVAYGLGGAFASEEVGAGLRHNLDASFLLGSFHVQHSSIGLWGSRWGWMAGPMAATGFGEYPTYLGVEGGYGGDSSLAGAAILVGPIVRVDPEVGGGGTARLTADLFLFELGLRAVAIAFGDPELQLDVLIGIGRY